MNNKILNRVFLILLILSLSFNNSSVAKEHSKKVRTSNGITDTQNLSLILLKYYYKYDLEKNNSLISEEIYSTEEEESYSKKSPWLAFFLSYIFPVAGGQFYNGEYGKALLIDAFITVGLGLFMLGAMSINYDSESNPNYIDVLIYSGLGISGGAYLYSIIDAPISANKINERNRQANKIKLLSSGKGKYSIDIGYSKFYKSYLVGMQFNF